MVMRGQIKIEDLSEELKEQLGLENSFDEELVSPRTEALGKVLRALKGLTIKQAVSVLDRALEHIADKPVTTGKALASHPVTINLVLMVVAATFNLSVEDLKGKRRTAEIALGRQVAMYILSMRDKYTLTTIGDALGGRCPATISHGFQVVAERIRRNTTLRNKVEEVEAEITTMTIKQ